MQINNILKQACKNVFNKTHGLYGTAEGRIEHGRGAGGDISRKIDLVAEKAVIDIIHEHKFNPTIIGEECGRIEGNDGFIIMDAIDGTANAIRGTPFFCCSLAYSEKFNLKSVSAAAVIDLYRGETYHASSGNGAFLDDQRINTLEISDNKDMVIGMNISGLGADLIGKLLSIVSDSNHIRHYGANALELCFLARGYLDAYIDIRDKIRPTDMAASYLIVNEAGGTIHSLDGKILDSDLAVDSRMSFLAVANEKIYQRISSYLEGNQ